MRLYKTRFKKAFGWCDHKGKVTSMEMPTKLYIDILRRLYYLECKVNKKNIKDKQWLITDLMEPIL